MFRKQMPPAQAYRLSSVPFNPITGEYSPIGRHGILSRCAMMQVIGDDETVANQDKHENYVICRGYDPESKHFLDSVPVAKPYGTRGSFPYKLAEVYPAIKPRTALGDTPMVAETTEGHPADLDEALDILKDDDDNHISWLLLDPGGIPMRWGKMDGPVSAGGTVTVSLWQATGGGREGWDEDSGDNWEDVYAPPLLQSGNVVEGKWVLVGNINGRKVIIGHEC
jgi:hypothetical protein